MTPNETIEAGLLIVGMAFLCVAVSSSVLHYFVALKARPTRRALWTAGIPFVLTAILFMFYLPTIGSGFASPWLLAILGALAALPGGVAAFWFWKREFQSAWVDDPANMPDGVGLANDDWRIGLGMLAVLIVVAVFKVLFRRLFA
jgi:hypothetical protein